MMRYHNWQAVLHEAPVAVRMPAQVAPSAVLVTVTADEAPFIVLTRRSAHLKKHAGQISFPGGRVDDSDKDLTQTALREAQEEIGLRADGVALCGFLPDMLTGTGYRITPVVARTHQTRQALATSLIANPQEVDEILFVPLSLALSVENYDSFLREDSDVTWRSWRLTSEGHVIWGATAAILHHWAARL